nr:hypothetical protein [Chromatiaceae bacterium]
CGPVEVHTQEGMKKKGRNRKKLRAGKPNHRPKTQRLPDLGRTPEDQETLDRWLTSARAAIVTQTRYLDENWPSHWT